MTNHTPKFQFAKAPEGAVRDDPSGPAFVPSNASRANRRCEIRQVFSPHDMRLRPAMPMFFAFARAGAALRWAFQSARSSIPGARIPAILSTARAFYVTNRAFSRTPRDVTTRARGRGGIGRRKGLKIPRWQRRAGSIPAVRTST